MCAQKLGRERMVRPGFGREGRVVRVRGNHFRVACAITQVGARAFTLPAVRHKVSCLKTCKQHV